MSLKATLMQADTYAMYRENEEKQSIWAQRSFMFFRSLFAASFRKYWKHPRATNSVSVVAEDALGRDS